MKRSVILAHEFVKTIPNDLEDYTLYVSVDYATVVHKCCCGCGREVVTPLSPTDWRLVFDGESISVCPSVGNWSFECRSHYWITRSTVKWAGQWSSGRIKAGREQDRILKERYYGENEMAFRRTEDAARKGTVKKFWKWLSNLRRS